MENFAFAHYIAQLIKKWHLCVRCIIGVMSVPEYINKISCYSVTLKKAMYKKQKRENKQARQSTFLKLKTDLLYEVSPYQNIHLK